MVVYSCHTPSGRVAGTAGWSLSAVGGPTTQAGTRDNCASGPTGVLAAQLATPGAGGRTMTWKFSAPQTTRIGAFSAAVCGRAISGPGSTGIYWEGEPQVPQDFISYGSAAAPIGCQGAPPWRSNPRNLRQASGLASAPTVEFYVACYDAECPEPGGVAVSMEISSFRAEIVDGSAPAVSAVKGPVTGSAAHAGTETITLNATDTGVGLYRVLAQVRDGDAPWTDVASSPIAGGSCRALAETSYPYEFDNPVPCPLAVSEASLSLDNALIAPGTHQLRVLVEDAAGNRTVAFESSAYVVAQLRGTPNNGTGASANAQVKITVPGKRRVPSNGRLRIAGRLLNADSAPIAGASLTVETRALFPKTGAAAGDWTPVGELMTDAKGVFRGRIPGGASRTLRVSYKANTADATPSAIASADVVVPAQITAKARRRNVRNRHSAVFTGRVAGPRPAGGVRVGLEVRQGSRWIPVATTRRWTRTSKRGTFTLRYRFLRTFQRTTYRFRVVADEDSAFEYARGVSRTVRVRVRP